MSKGNRWAWLAGAALIAAGVIFGLYVDLPDGGVGTDSFDQRQNKSAPDVIPKNAPVVTAFLGDLADGGNKLNDGVIPFVIGDILTLECEAVNAVEYRWTVNGQVIKEKDQEWSARKDREFEIKAAGELTFGVQVRGADAKAASNPKEITVKSVPIVIISFEQNIVEEEDRCLTGEDYSVEVSLHEPITADLDFYELRYFVNDAPVKHPDDGKEWTTEREFTHTFTAPGEYSFKVEARRATQKEPEATAILAQTIVVADAVLLTFDAAPDKYAPLGATVTVDAFPESIFGKSEVRFGAKKVAAADFEWIPDEDGTTWGASVRSWLPSEPGNYLLRAEVRESGKERADDSKEILYTIIQGDF